MRPGFLKATSLAAAVLLALGAMAGKATEAEAAFALRVSDGTTTVAVPDGTGADQDGRVGAITYISVGVFTGWTISVTTGMTDPLLSPPLPHLSLDSIQMSSIGGGSLTVELSETDISTGASIAPFNTSISGVTAGTVEFQSFVNPDNTLFSTAGTQVADLGPLSGVMGFSAQESGWAPVSSPYGVTLRWIITHGGAGSTDGKAEFQIPEPESLALFGFGLLGLGSLLMRRRRGAARLAA